MRKRPRALRGLQAAILAATCCGSSAAFAADPAPSAACAVAIANPQNGDTVGASGMASGQASIPDSLSLWVLLRPSGFDGWWPQGGGGAAVNDGAWRAMVFYGSPQDIGHDFDLIAMPVDAKVSDQLSQWYAHANATHDFAPIPLPSAAPGCPVARVRVHKTG